MTMSLRRTEWRRQYCCRLARLMSGMRLWHAERPLFLASNQCLVSRPRGRLPLTAGVRPRAKQRGRSLISTSGVISHVYDFSSNTHLITFISIIVAVSVSERKLYRKHSGPPSVVQWRRLANRIKTRFFLFLNTHLLSAQWTWPLTFDPFHPNWLKSQSFLTTHGTVCPLKCTTVL